MMHEMAFDPTELRTLGIVFEETWQSFVTDRPESLITSEMRLRLASILLLLARDHQLGPPQMKATAVRLLDQEYPRFATAG